MERRVRTRIMAIAAALLAAGPAAAIQPGAKAPEPISPDYIWKPAATPPGGTPWALLESTREVQRNERGVIYSRPQFPPAVQALNGKRVRVAGWVMPLQQGELQKHFVLLAYPPGCPFHLHAGPTQFVEVKTADGVPFSYDSVVIEGTLQLLGQDESGIFYRIYDGRRLAAR
jgi:hypothetical protein